MRRSWVPLYEAICRSSKMADLPDDTARLAYILILAQCDAWGRARADPRALGSLIWPQLKKRPSELPGALDAMEALGLIQRGTDPVGDEWLVIPDWESKAGTHIPPARRGPEPPPLRLSTLEDVDPEEIRIRVDRGVANPSGTGAQRVANPFEPVAYLTETFPDQVPALLPTVQRWVEYRRELGLKPWKAPTWKLQLARAASAPAIWCAEIAYAISKGYHSPIEGKTSDLFSGNGNGEHEPHRPTMKPVPKKEAEHVKP